MVTMLPLFNFTCDLRHPRDFIPGLHLNVPKGDLLSYYIYIVHTCYMMHRVVYMYNSIRIWFLLFESLVDTACSDPRFGDLRPHCCYTCCCCAVLCCSRLGTWLCSVKRGEAASCVIMLPFFCASIIIEVPGTSTFNMPPFERKLGGG